MKIRNMTRCAIAAALMAVCAWITLPGPVPFTLQTFGVFLILGLLGGRSGTAAIGTYLALGFLGLPVFSGFRGGPAVLLGATGGYLSGFLAAGGVYWLLERFKIPKVAAMALGMLCCYGFGTGWFLAFFARGSSVWTVLGSCVFPFLLPDGLKIGLALMLSRRLRPYIR